MKNDWKFTAGEWAAAVTVLLVITGCHLFYWFYDNRRAMPFDLYAREAEIEAFVALQQHIGDSIRARRDSARRFGRNAYGQRPFRVGDTFPRDTFAKRPKRRLYEIVKLDLNHCDTNEIINIPQFGSKRAAKLVEYREELGGFYSLEQVHEIYILQNIETEFLAQYFYIRPNDVEKININSAEYKDLIGHPYFDAYLTKTILNYRRQHGDIASLEELRRITHAYPELMEKLRHYITF